MKTSDQKNRNARFPVFHVPHDGQCFPPELLDSVCIPDKKRYADAGYTVAVNYPYSGCYIPNAVWNGKSSCDCIGIMLEHHKRAYCDDQSIIVPEKLARIRDIIRHIPAEYPEQRWKKRTQVAL